MGLPQSGVAGGDCIAGLRVGVKESRWVETETCIIRCEVIDVYGATNLSALVGTARTITYVEPSLIRSVLLDNV